MSWRLLSIFFIFFFLVLLFPQKLFATTVPQINEVLVHPSSGNKEWVEFYNPDTVDMSQYWIDDDTDFTNDAGNSSKKSLQTGIGLSSQYAYIEISSMFNNSGDSVVLFAPDGTIIDQYQYAEDPGIDVAIGRNPDGVGQFVALQTATKGSANSAPVPTPTATPTPTPKPTPTDTPVPPTATPTASYPVIPTPKPLDTPIRKVMTPTLISDESSIDAVLGTMSAADLHKVTPKPTEIIADASEEKSFLPVIFILAGFCLLATCAILIFLQTEKGQTVWKKFF